MSTKTSNDMHVGRSTTRRHAPPGGVSTFSVAWEENPKDTKVSAVVNEIEEGLFDFIYIYILVLIILLLIIILLVFILIFFLLLLSLLL